MRIELIKKTVRGTGKVWYHVDLDGSSVDGTWTYDEKKAMEHFEDTKKTVLKYPVDTTDVLKSEDI